jgi:hypothetical protein
MRKTKTISCLRGGGVVFDGRVGTGVTEMSRVTLVWNASSEKRTLKKVIKLPSTWDVFAARVRLAI